MPKTVKKEKAEIMVVKDETVDVVLSRVQEFQNKGELDLPGNYSAPNALKSAWLILQNTVDKDKKPVLEVCTKASIANTMLDMVVQGLNPSKQQCYFIAYGRVLTMARSYLGNKAICLRVDPDLKDIYAECVYEGDEVEYEIRLGQRHIISHKQKLQNVTGANIVAAYAIAVTKDDVAKQTELMTMDEIKAAWAQSKMHPITDKGHIKAGSTHGKFTSEMAKKTVTNRMAKHIIGSSDDATLAPRMKESVIKTDDLAAQADAESEVGEHANVGDVIDIKAEPKKPAETKKTTAKKPAEKKAAPDPEQEKAHATKEPPPMTDEEKQAIIAEEEAADHIANGRPPF